MKLIASAVVVVAVALASPVRASDASSERHAAWSGTSQAATPAAATSQAVDEGRSSRANARKAPAQCTCDRSHHDDAARTEQDRR